MGLGFGITKTSSGGGGGGTTITTVANYSALPSASSVSGKFYWCEASQGTKWLPFSVGGTYYPLGMYYSNGVTWEYTETPYQATLSEVNTGTNTDKFVSPYTFENASKWGEYVPYVGATTNVDLGTYNLTADHIILNTSPSDGGFVVGSTEWNNIDGTSETLLKGGNVILKNGVDLVARVVNNTGINLTKASYQVVRISGAQGQRLAVDLAQANNDANSVDTLGVVAENINNNLEGFIITVGQLLNINTTGSLQGETWVDGDTLYLSPTIAGAITNIKPTALVGHIVVLGYVEYAHANNGKIYVKIMNGWELDELHNVYINPSTLANNDVLAYNSTAQLWENETITTILGYAPAVSSPDLIFVYAKSDLPTPSSGVISLVNNVTYYIATDIDLTGDRLVCGVNTTILGASSENCILRSTGLSASTALITSNYSLPIRNITITHDIALNLIGDGITTALDWFGVNFTNCATVGTISNYTNFIMNDSAFLNSQGLTFDGTIGTIGMTNCLFDCYAGGTAITLPSTLTVSRRFRIIYSSFVVLSGETGINASTSAIIGNEKYILDTVNFSGGGTYLSGLDATSNISLFANCVGITNTSTRGFMYMLDNTTATAITGTASYFKAAGTTLAMSTNSKFTMPASNRLTYTGAFTQSFMITLNCNVRTSVSTQTINIVIAKNGARIPESEMTILCAAGSTPSFGATQIVVELTTDDYVELFVRNTSSVNNIIVSDLNMNVVKIPV